MLPDALGQHLVAAKQRVQLGWLQARRVSEVALGAVLEVVLQVVVVRLRQVLLVGAVDDPRWLVWRTRGCFESC
jgi:hypothetical protein